MFSFIFFSSFNIFFFAPSVFSEAVDFTYENGGFDWFQLSLTCRDGRRQSPINLRSTSSLLSKPTEKLRVNWDNLNSSSIPVDFKERKTVEFGPLSNTSSAQNTVTFDNRTYALSQIHVHTPSEHRIDNQISDMEVHFVHKNAAGKILVVGNPPPTAGPPLL